VILPNRAADTETRLQPAKATWLLDLIQQSTPACKKHGEGYPALKDVRATYPFGGNRGFDALVKSVPWKKVRAAGLLLV
jgi:hypothetical protein